MASPLRFRGNLIEGLELEGFEWLEVLLNLLLLDDDVCFIWGLVLANQVNLKPHALVEHDRVQALSLENDCVQDLFIVNKLKVSKIVEGTLRERYNGR